MKTDITLDQRSHIFLQYAALLSENLEKSGETCEANIARTTLLFRQAFDELCQRGYPVPEVDNLPHAKEGEECDFSTVAAIVEIVFDAILYYSSDTRDCRYKCNDYGAFLDMSMQDRLLGKSFDLKKLKSNLNYRTRRLGSVMISLTSLVLTPSEMKRLFLSLIVDDLMKGYDHIFKRVQENSWMLSAVLKNLGLTGSVLAEHFICNSPTPLKHDAEQCQDFVKLMEILHLDDHAFQQSWNLLWFDSLYRDQEKHFFRDDGCGGLEERLQSGYLGNNWITWVPMTRVSPH